MKTLILTEKPSVARDIAKVIGVPKKQEGFIEVNNYVISWAVGHLVSLAAPESYKKEWESWSMDHLPMIPEKFKITINKRTAKQFKIVKDLMVSPDIDRIIFATDAGPEGELIARWIYQKTNCRKPIERLWISSLTKESIQEGLKNLKPSAEFDSLFHAAVARARADWLVGLNTTRAVTNVMKAKDSSATTYSCGRVQSPTLKKVVERCLEINNFVPQTYFEIHATFQDADGQNYDGRYYNFSKQSGRIEIQEAEDILAKVMNQETNKVELCSEEVFVDTPELLSLPTLQQKCSAKFGITVAKVDEIAQSLYEKGLITYPRTADCLVTPDVASEFPEILKRLDQGYQDIIPSKPRSLANNSRYVGPVSDHHALIPTGNLKSLDGLEQKIFDFIVKTFIAAHHPPGMDLNIKIHTVVTQVDFLSNQTYIITPGWRSVFGAVTSKEKPIDSLTVPIRVLSLNSEEEQTAPPPYYTEASLVKVMEKHHLGTPATRSAIIENLKQKDYLDSDKNRLIATKKAINLINHLTGTPLISVSMTAQWEEKLKKIQNNQCSYEEFNKEVDQFVANFIKEQKAQMPEKSKATVLGKCPQCKEGTVIKIQKDKNNWFYGCNKQKNGCQFFVSGEIAGTKIKDEDIIDLLTKGLTKTKTFQFKNAHKKSQAQLSLKTNGQTEFIFKKSLGQRIGQLLGLKGG